MAETDPVNNQTAPEKKTLDFLSNAVAMVLILLAWLAGSSFIITAWLNVGFAQKVLWAVVLWIWIILSPVVLSLVLLGFSLVALLTGSLSATEVLSALALAVLSVGFRGLVWIWQLWPWRTSMLFRQLTFMLISLCQVESSLAGLRLAFLLEHGRIGNAQAFAQALLDRNQRFFGNDSICLVDPLHMLASVLERQGKLSLAEADLKRALSICAAYQPRQFGEPPYIATLDKLGSLYSAGLRFEQAEAMYNRMLEGSQKLNIGRSVFGEALCRIGLAKVYVSQGKLAEAEDCLNQSKQVLSRMGGLGALGMMALHKQTATLRVREGKLDEADDLLKEAIKLFDKHVKSSWSSKMELIVCQGLLESERNDLQKAQSLYEQAIALATEHLPPNNPEFVQLLRAYATLLAKQSRQREAAETNERANAILSSLWEESPATASH